MESYKGRLHESAVKFKETEIWMDSCGEEALNYAIERGIVSATSNPSIVLGVIKTELDIWEKRILDLILTMTSATEDEIAWALIYEIVELRAKKLLPIYEQYKGKKGRISLQTNIKNYRNAEKNIEQGIEINKLGINIQVKAPANKAGICAMEEMTYLGISINATVSFTVAQAIAVAEAVERGLLRREKEGLDTSTMSPVCTLMIGRTDDWMKAYCNKTGLLVIPECLEWAGIAVFKRSYEIYKQRGFRTRLLSAANRNVYHWSELVGLDVSQTINYDWQKKLEKCNVEPIDCTDKIVNPIYIEALQTIPDFAKAYDPDGMTLEEFESCYAFQDTLTSFLAGYDELCKLVRGYMIRPVR